MREIFPSAVQVEVSRFQHEPRALLILERLHLKTHETYRCETCDMYFRDSKDAKKDLERHKQTKAHQKKLGVASNTSQFVCPVEWCAKSMPRKDNLNRHIKSQHPEYQPLGK